MIGNKVKLQNKIYQNDQICTLQQLHVVFILKKKIRIALCKKYQLKHQPNNPSN